MACGESSGVTPSYGENSGAGAAPTSCLIHSVDGTDEEQGIGLRVLHEDQQQLQGHLHHQAKLRQGTVAVAGYCWYRRLHPLSRAWLHQWLW